MRNLALAVSLALVLVLCLFAQQNANTIGGTVINNEGGKPEACLLYTSPSPRDGLLSRMPSSA